jgi:RecA-family ATPase
MSGSPEDFAHSIGLEDIPIDEDPSQGRDDDGHGTADQPGKPNDAPPKMSEMFGPLPFINIAPWDDALPPARKWAIPDRIPIDQPTLFSGEGAAGKSLLELQLAIAHVLGQEWLGFSPEPGPSIYVGAEDVVDELNRRTYDITKYYDVRYADLVRGGLYLLSFAGEDCLLGVAAKGSEQVEPTILYKRLLEAVGDIKPKHIGIDTAADTFGGNEINRSQVRQYVGLLRKLAIVGHSSLVLLLHPSLTGISSGSGLSGSTAWHNSVRARMYLRHPQNKKEDNKDGNGSDEDDEPINTDLRELVFKKNNYGPISGTLKLRYKNGLFLPETEGEGSPSFLHKLAREQAIDGHFLLLLRKLTGQSRNVSPNPGKSYAPAIFAAHPDGRYNSKDLALAMERLLEQRSIHIVKSGPPSRQREHLVEGAAPHNGPEPETYLGFHRSADGKGWIKDDDPTLTPKTDTERSDAT